jgi:hypothetical protein
LNLCAVASGKGHEAPTVPEHVLEMFENETMVDNETNDTLVLILTPQEEPINVYTFAPTTLSPTFAPTQEGETSAPTTLAPTPAPAPKASVTVEMALESAADFNLNAFMGEMAMGGANITDDVEFKVKYTVSMEMKITGDVDEEDLKATFGDLLGVDASIIDIEMSRRLKGRRLTEKSVKATAESEDAAAIDAAKAKGESVDSSAIIAGLQKLDATKYASVSVADVTPPKVAAKVEITQTTTEEAGADLASTLAASVGSINPASVGSTGFNSPPVAAFTVMTAEPTSAPTSVPTEAPPTPAPPTPAPPTPAPPTTEAPTTEAPTTEAPTDENPEEESGASFERAGLLTVAVLAFTSIVSTQ